MKSTSCGTCLGLYCCSACWQALGLGSYLAFGINRSIQQRDTFDPGTGAGRLAGPCGGNRAPKKCASWQERVNTLVDKLHSLEKARRQLFANLVHELGRPAGGAFVLPSRRCFMAPIRIRSWRVIC